MERSDVLRKVQALLDRASSSDFTAEAESCRRKADDMMLAYQIELWEVNQKREKALRVKPEVRDFSVAPAEHPIKDTLISLFSVVSAHVGSRPVFYGAQFKHAKITAKVVGFPEDLDFLEMIYVSLQVQMSRNLEPKPDPAKSFEENLVALKEAGVKWVRIHELLLPDVPFERRHGVRYTGIYTKYCRDHNRERMYTSPVTYQRNYANGFVQEVQSRLTQIRLAQKRDSVDEGSGMELMLRDKKQEVGELFEETFKNLTSLKSKTGTFDPGAYRKGRSDGSKADLGQKAAGGGPRAIQ